VSKPLFGIFMGSDPDWPTMKTAVEDRAEYGVASKSSVIVAGADSISWPRS
jgi:phosphoribosylcarboxyaminoimidazole (NCAIR) mutase